jgi:hypothetical protein
MEKSPFSRSGADIGMIFTMDVASSPLMVVCRCREGEDLVIFINRMSNGLLDGGSCRRIAHLAWIGKVRPAVRNS